MAEGERDHVADLERLREMWVEQRRDYVQHLTSGNFKGSKERALDSTALVDIQKRIEALDRAIADEKTLLPPPVAQAGKFSVSR